MGSESVSLLQPALRSSARSPLEAWAVGRSGFISFPSPPYLTPYLPRIRLLFPSCSIRSSSASSYDSDWNGPHWTRSLLPASEACAHFEDWARLPLRRLSRPLVNQSYYSYMLLALSSSSIASPLSLTACAAPRRSSRKHTAPWRRWPSPIR